MISVFDVIEYEGKDKKYREGKMRKPFMAGNWKMNGSLQQVSEFIEGFIVSEETAKEREVIICAPFTLIPACVAKGAEKKPYMKFGAQNVHWEPKGAFTGEVSVGMLKESGCYCCIIGHSERRQYNKETDEMINKKMNALLDGGVLPIVCVGETLEEREAGRTEEVVSTQVRGSIVASVGAKDLSGIVIAYEPVWAIGTGKTATPEQAEEVCGMIRTLVAKEIGGAIADGMRILYGGSMNAANVDVLMAQPDIDGGLVGGASLKAPDFSRIAEYIKQ